MEEKKKVSVATILLTVVVIILVAICALMYVQMEQTKAEITELNEKISNLEKDDSKSNIDVENQNEDDANDIGEKFIQFDTDFFEIEKIAKESISSEDIENVKEVNYDLDGDGVQDKITVERPIGSDMEVILKLNGTEFASYVSGINSMHIVDFNENDKSMEVVVSDYGGSDDFGYTIYSKQSSSMNHLQNVNGDSLMTDKKGTTIAKGEFSDISPIIFEEYYIIRNGELETKKIDSEKYKDIEFSCEHLYFTTDLDNLDKYWEYSDLSYSERFEKANIKEMDKSIKFNISGFTDDGEIIVQLTDGTKGYLLSGKGFLAG